MLELEQRREHQALGLSDAQAVDIYRYMLMARRLDDRLWTLNRQGRIPFVVSGAGHEAAQVGAAFALDSSTDWSLPYYRDLAFNLSLGVPPEAVLLAALARADDPTSGGRQMPNHWSEPDLNIFTHSSVIATQFPHACGIAYQLQAEGRPGVVFVSSGEGATSEGDFHEAMNFASIHRLPIVFLIQNNQYAISVPVDEEVAGSLTRRAESYGTPGVEVDGNDVLEVYGAASTAVDRARDGEGPTLIEAKTYRYYAHTSDDDDRAYRSAEEVEQWKRRDPLARYRQYLIESRLLPEATERELEEQTTSIIARAVTEAEAAPEPTDAASGVYALDIEPDPSGAVTIEPEPQGPEVNLVTAVNQAMHELLESYPEACVFGEDVADPKGGVFRASTGLTDTFGEHRSFNAPLSESLIVGAGIGAAAVGGKPIAEIQFADFIHPAFDQIVSEAARIHYRSNGRWNCPLVIRCPYGGGVHGALYHSQSVEALYAHVPGLKVVIPSTPADAKGLLRSAVEDPDPVMFFEPKKLYRLAKGPVPTDVHRVPIGRAALRRTGIDLVIIAYGTMAHFAVAAADELAEEDIDATVLDLRSLKPLDWPSIESAVRATGKVLVVHEDNEFVGFGAEISAQIMEKAFDWLDAPVQRYAAPDVPAFPYAEPLEARLMPDQHGIVARARELAAY